MKDLTPQASLTFFERNLPDYLSTDDKINGLIVNLKDCLKKEGAADFHSNVLKSGKNLIKHIILKSIEFLSDESDSPKNRSIKNISAYIDTFTAFEEMLFGLKPTYRDHTLHSLWVYLFGHEFIMCMGGYDAIKIAGQVNITYIRGGEPLFVLGTRPISVNRAHLEAMWGMISILHDLGYPVEAFSNRPHEVFGRILEPFAIDFGSILQLDIGSRITLLHQSLCDLLSTMYRPEGLTAEETKYFEKEADERASNGLLYVVREPTTTKAEAIEMEFRIASVDKTHSAWSAIFAFKNIAYLHESDYHGGGNRDYLKLLTKRDILYSIVHHTSEEPKDEAVNRFQLILLLMDDIEETIRYSRGGTERGMVSDYCDVKWEVSKTETTIALDYTGYNLEAQSKYKEMENKYKAQISRTNNDSVYGYIIKIRFIDGKNHFQKDLKLFFSKEKEGMEDSEAIPSLAIPDSVGATE
ncbi:MAG: hypothetical protein NT140_05620 [Deltaproteobacteria bacterium]|nr:hypothetical protein [Deltaproteobacteria bacterium]